MNSGDSATVTRPPSPGLTVAANQLRSAQDSQTRGQAAQVLLQAAREYAAGPLDIAMLTDAADALLAALAEEQHREQRRALAEIGHEFIDLARLPSVRRAAYPAEAGQPGGRWLDRTIQLIERTDFTVGSMFRQRAAQYAHKTLFRLPRGEAVTDYSWQQVSEATRQIARGVLALLGDEPRVAILTPNRIEGALFDLACLTNGIFDAVVPANAVEAQVAHILCESGARLLAVSGGEHLRTALAAVEHVPTVEWVVTLDTLPTVPGARVLGLDQLLERAAEVSSAALDERAARVRSADVATTMYTSGTTGAPKGIKFSHFNLVTKRFARAAALPDIDENEVFLCYLPLYHTFGRYLEMLGAIHLAATYIFAESAAIETLIQNMRRFRPTALIGVPKKWSELYQRVPVADAPATDPPQLRQTLATLTGGRLRWGLSAAGRLDPAIFRFFQSCGVDLLSGYGMTEATGGVTMTPPGCYVEESIGRPLPAIELRLNSDNELLLRGPYVTAGYTDPAEDAQAFREGWFCTGDIVSRDAAGFFRLLDRKKDIYKSASGRTVAPQRIEGLFADFPEVSRVFAVGDGREYVTLLIRPNTSALEPGLGRMSDAALREYFRGLVVSCNRFLAPFERVVNFALIDRDFSAEAGELTPKGSFRRSVVLERFRDVIEPMYASTAVERTLNGLRVLIPIAFLRHLGITESDACVGQDGLVFCGIPRPAGATHTDKELRIAPDPDTPGRVWIGNCCYEPVERTLDLDDWLRLPRLWVGNAELTELSGESILLWSLAGDDRATPCKLIAVRTPRVPIDPWRQRLETMRAAAPSLLSLHAAAVVLSAGPCAAALKAVDYLAHVMTAGRVRYQELAEWQLLLARHHREQPVRGRAFATLWEHQDARAFRITAQAYCESGLDFLDEQAAACVARSGLRPPQWQALVQALAGLRQHMVRTGSTAHSEFVLRLLRGLGRVAELNEDFYLPVRQELMAWILAPVSGGTGTAAQEIIARLTASFRQRLGAKQTTAIDPHTGQAYTWADTVQFEDGIDPEELGRLSAALQQTELLREAVYVLHQRRMIDLADLAPNSIWVSLVGTRFGRSLYHVEVRLRDGERCDFMLYVRGTAAATAFLTDLHLMAVAAGLPGEAPLTAQLGGYWPQYDLASLEHIPGQSLETLVGYMYEHPDRRVREHLDRAGKHLCWTALAAAFEFHRRSEGRWMLTGSVTRDIAVPLNDFDPNTRISSAAGWQPFRGALDMLVRLKRAALDRLAFQFPALIPQGQEELLFAAVLEVYGWQAGLAFLKDAIADAQHLSAPSREVVELCSQMEAYVARASQQGYMPKAVYFAIDRYRAWAAQVPDAGAPARAAQLRQLERNYRIDTLLERFPDARLWLYAETVLRDSPAAARAIIEQGLRDLRDGAAIATVLGRLYTDLRQKLPSHDQQYFLTRAAYPHLDLHEKAELVTTTEAGPARAELVTVHTDQAGREVRIRPAASPSELDSLYRIFYTSGIGGGLTGAEQFLIALDQAGHVVGGVASLRRTPYHVLLDRVAVSPRWRGRGIGRLLVQEFLRRQAAAGVAMVSAELIRHNWLAKFGFQPHPRYAGVILALQPERSGIGG